VSGKEAAPEAKPPKPKSKPKTKPAAKPKPKPKPKAKGETKGQSSPHGGGGGPEMCWRAPTAAEEAAGAAIVGRRVRVAGHGVGEVLSFAGGGFFGFLGELFGASAHILRLHGGEEVRVKLARNGNGDAAWEVWDTPAEEAARQQQADPAAGLADENGRAYPTGPRPRLSAGCADYLCRLGRPC
jgi:hypothetical protein